MTGMVLSNLSEKTQYDLVSSYVACVPLMDTLLMLSPNVIVIPLEPFSASTYHSNQEKHQDIVLTQFPVHKEHVSKEVLRQLKIAFVKNNVKKSQHEIKK